MLSPWAMSNRQVDSQLRATDAARALESRRETPLILAFLAVTPMVSMESRQLEHAQRAMPTAVIASLVRIREGAGTRPLTNWEEGYLLGSSTGMAATSAGFLDAVVVPYSLIW